ncbi:MAG TPA: site-specific integrase [Haliangium sp.]|nr:site-specific integrase [Haliangium sp.]
MEITEHNLAKFRSWVLDRGRSSGTAALYVSNLKSCAKDRQLTRRLVAGRLAPNSLRTNMAALRAWAKFSKNPEMAEVLKDIRLPPARRLSTKQPLDLEQWREVIRHMQTCSMRNEAMRQVLLIMAIRGLRCSDVLRMRSDDVLRALATGKLVYEGKGRKRMEISAEPIRKQLRELAVFQDWERVRDLISASKNPEVARVMVYRAAKRTAAKVDIINMSPHRYRHTFAANYLSQLAGDPNAIVKLQRYMGWESMETAARYVSAVSQDELDNIGAGLVSGLLKAPAVADRAKRKRR